MKNRFLRFLWLEKYQQENTRRVPGGCQANIDQTVDECAERKCAEVAEDLAIGYRVGYVDGWEDSPPTPRSA